MIVGPLKTKVNYIVTKASDDGLYEVGERLMFKYNKKKYDYGGDEPLFGRFETFGPPKKTDKPFGPLEPMNHVRYFKTEEDLLKALKGIEVVKDTKWANEQIKEKKEEIAKLEKEYF